MNEQATYEILAEIRDELIAQNQQDNALWDAAAIGRYLGLKKSTVQTRVLCRKTFPRARLLQISDTGAGSRRWLAAEVRAWATKVKEPMR